MNIKGKEYVAVNERIRAFRSLEEFKGYKLVSEFVSMNDKECIIKASVLNEKNETVATGLAHEVRGSGNVNKTSHIENAETSAFGRALGNLGIGVDTSIASSDEVTNAIQQQEQDVKDPVINEKQICTILDLINQTGVDVTQEMEAWAEGLRTSEFKKYEKTYRNKLNNG